MLTAVFLQYASLSAGIAVDAKSRTQEERSTDSSRDIDHDLVEKARSGDIASFRELVNRYQNRAFSIAIGVVGSREDAEDVVQEAFLKAYRNLASFRGQSSFYTWFYRIVFNLAIDLSRKRYRKSESSMGDAAAMDAVSRQSSGDASDFLGVMPGPEDELKRAALGKSLKEAIGNLSAEHRAVIILREIEGLSYSEISEAVGCSKGTVMSRLHHARKRLQKVLSDFAPLGGGRRPSASQSPQAEDQEGGEEKDDFELTQNERQ